MSALQKTTNTILIMKCDLFQFFNMLQRSFFLIYYHEKIISIRKNNNPLMLQIFQSKTKLMSQIRWLTFRKFSSNLKQCYIARLDLSIELFVNVFIIFFN